MINIDKVLNIIMFALVKYEYMTIRTGIDLAKQRK